MEMEMEMKGHVLVFPFPAQGHMIPLLDLSLSLASQGLALTLLTTSGNEHLLRPLLSTASMQGLHVHSLLLPLPPTQGLPPDLTTANITLELIPLLMYSLQGLARPLEHWLLQQKEKQNLSNEYGPVLCIISDFFLGWTHETAAKLGIPRIVFSPSGAFAVSVIASLWEHMPHLGVESDEDEVPIPGLPHPLTLRKFQLSRLVRAYRSSDPVYESIRQGMELNLKSWGSLINTFDSLESLYIDHLRTISGRPVWSVGPLLPPHSPSQRGNPNSINEALCLRWLDARKQSSVVYVCFGSIISLSEKQTEAIAAGLEASGESFIWVISDERKGSVTVPPVGFEERVKEKGLVIRGWAPQLLILSHSSVGAFVTHCGWNSTLESIAHGVPMIAWPFSADQHINALLCVQHLKVAVALCQGQHAVPDTDVLATAVKKVLVRQGEGEEEGEGGEDGDVGMRAQQLSRAAKDAVQQGGSSSSNLQQFVASIRDLAHNNL